MAEDNPSEDELEQEFRKDPQSGLQYLELFFRSNIFAYIKSQCPYFHAEDLKEVYQDTMRRMVKAACDPKFDPEKPMRLVQDIAWKAAADAKKKKKLRPVGDAREVAEMVGDDLKGTKVAMEWRLILKEDMPKVQRAIDEAIASLPTKQKAAATAMMHVYEEVHDTKSYLPLKNQIQQMTGEEFTTTQAYDNWRLARNAIAAKVQRAGCNLYDEE